MKFGINQEQSLPVHMTIADLRAALNGLPDSMVVNVLEPGQTGRPAQGYHVVGFEQIARGNAAPTFTIEVQPNKAA